MFILFYYVDYLWEENIFPARSPYGGSVGKERVAEAQARKQVDQVGGYYQRPEY